MSYDFSVNYKDILQRVDNINPVEYSRTRNFLNGQVTCLSPYIARGVISLPFIKQKLLERYSLYQAEKLIQELAWREYFQRVWQQLGNNIFANIRQPQSGFARKAIPAAVVQAQTGIEAIDQSIETLYQSGYMHNHARMYTAMLCCNVAQCDWSLPAQWMYYHLLDGDLASNTLSWQWVAGTFSSKKYYANQENINRYSGTRQSNSFLDHSYETIAANDIPRILTETITQIPGTTLPPPSELNVDHRLPLFLYNSYQLDPLWHAAEQGNRVLVLEPSHFKAFPVAAKVMDFIIRLAQSCIPGIQVFVGEVTEIPQLPGFPAIFYKEHPTATHYPGNCEPREWLFPEVTGYSGSFSAYWKKCEKYFR